MMSCSSFQRNLLSKGFFYLRTQRESNLMNRFLQNMRKMSTIQDYRNFMKKVARNFGDLEYRTACLGDKDQILAIEPRVHEGLDYLPALYDQYLKDPDRHLYVGVKDNEILSFGQAYIVDGKTTAALASGRTIHKYRGTGMSSALIYNLLQHLKQTVPSLKRFTGVYQLPQWTKEYLAKKASSGLHKTVSLRKADGFEVRPDDVKPLLERLNDVTTTQTPVRIPGKDIWQYLKSDVNRLRCFPDDEMLICSETYRPLEETFQQIKDTKARNAVMTFDDEKVISGISFRNSYPVPFGFLYKIDIFCQKDQQIFEHFVAQVSDGLQSQDLIYKDLNIMLAVFFPFYADKKSFLEKCKIQLKLDPSKNPKVGCDVTVVEYAFGPDPLRNFNAGSNGAKEPSSKL